MISAVSRDERWVATTRIEAGRAGHPVQRVGDARWREVIRGTTGERLFAIAWTSAQRAARVRATSPHGPRALVTEVWGITVPDAAAPSSRQARHATGLRRHESSDFTRTAGNCSSLPASDLLPLGTSRRSAMTMKPMLAVTSFRARRQAPRKGFCWGNCRARCAMPPGRCCPMFA